MKRSPIARRTPLARSTTPLARKPLRRRSKKMQTLYTDERIPFVKRLLKERPTCEVQWQDCTEASVDVHEYIARGIGGAIVPGDKADRQGQRFVAICRRCHGDLDLDLPRAREEGWIK